MEDPMKSFMLFTAGGPLVVLTKFQSPTDPLFLRLLEIKGIGKFIAHELPVDLVHIRYGHHFEAVVQDLHEHDALRVLDETERGFNLFRFDELGPAIRYDAAAAQPAETATPA
jgi:hypothetical protein